MPRPRKIEQAILAAFWLHLGRPGTEAAKLAGLGEKTLRRWKQRPEWAEIERLGRLKYLESLAADAREALRHAMIERDDATGRVKRADGKLALAVLERLQEELAPAPQAIELRALLQRLDPNALPDEVVGQLADGKNVAGILMTLLAREGAAGLLKPGRGAGEIVVQEPGSDPEGPA